MFAIGAHMGSNQVGEKSHFVAHRKGNIYATDHSSEVCGNVYPLGELGGIDSPGKLAVS